MHRIKKKQDRKYIFYSVKVVKFLVFIDAPLLHEGSAVRKLLFRLRPNRECDRWENDVVN